MKNNILRWKMLTSALSVLYKEKFKLKIIVFNLLKIRNLWFQ